MVLRETFPERAGLPKVRRQADGQRMVADEAAGRVGGQDGRGEALGEGGDRPAGIGAERAAARPNERPLCTLEVGERGVGLDLAVAPFGELDSRFARSAEQVGGHLQVDGPLGRRKRGPGRHGDVQPDPRTVRDDPRALRDGLEHPGLVRALVERAAVHAGAAERRRDVRGDDKHW